MGDRMYLSFIPTAIQSKQFNMRTEAQSVHICIFSLECTIFKKWYEGNMNQKKVFVFFLKRGRERKKRTSKVKIVDKMKTNQREGQNEGESQSIITHKNFVKATINNFSLWEFFAHTQAHAHKKCHSRGFFSLHALHSTKHFVAIYLKLSIFLFWWFFVVLFLT